MELRLQAEDPDVLARTEEALKLSTAISKPALEIRCQACGSSLAGVADIPGFGPLFVSSWENVIDVGPHVVDKDGGELSARARAKKRKKDWTLVSSSGPPMTGAYEPHGVIALIGSDSADCPDLLVRCRTHHDAVLDRIEVIKWLRSSVSVKTVHLGERHTYHLKRAPRDRTKKPDQSETWQSKPGSLPTLTTVAELQERKRRQAEHIRRRRNEKRDTES